MNTPSSTDLAILDNCAKGLAKAERIDQLTDLRSTAEAIRVWAKSAKQSLEVQNRAAALRLGAERKIGKVLMQLHLRGGDRKSKTHAPPLILADLGVTRDQSTRWQKLSTIPDEQFEKYVDGSTLIGKEITAAGLLRLASERKGEQEDNGRSGNHKSAVKTKQESDVEVLSVEGIEAISSDLREAAEHVNTLLQVLTPYASGEIEGLSQPERRLVLYYLGEINSLLKRFSSQKDWQ